MVEGPDLAKAVFVRCLGVQTVGSRRAWGGLDEDEDDDEMNDNGDNTGAFGFVEVLCGYTGSDEGDRDMDLDNRRRNTVDEERIVRMRRGEVWLVRWGGVRDAVARGECELI